MFNMLPLFLGAAAEEYGLTPDKIGFLSAIEMGGIAFISLLGPFWINRFNWRRMAIAVTVMIFIVNLITMAAKSYEALLIVRLLAGLVEGAIYSLSIAVVSEYEKPDRAFGFMFIAQVGAGAIGLICLPMLVAAWGITPILLYLALLSVVVLPVLKWMPLPVKSVKTQTVQIAQITFPIYIPLIGILILTIWCCNLGAFWAFVERIGDHAGMDAQTIGIALTIGMLSGIPGAGAAAWFSDKYGRIWPFCLTLIVQTGVMYALVGALGSLKLTVIMICYNSVWSFGQAYLMGIIATSDSSARTAVLMPVSQALGVGAGSAIAGILASEHGYTSINLFAAGCCFISMILFVPFALRVVRGNIFSSRQLSS